MKHFSETKENDLVKFPNALRTGFKFVLSNVVVCLLLLFSARAALALPTDFQIQNVVTGLNQPVYLVQLPDGRMLVAGKFSLTYIFDPQSPGTVSPYLQINSVEVGNERGTTSIALDPNFTTNGYLYVFYAHKPSGKFRISRFTHLGNTADSSSEFLVWEDNEQWPDDCCHYGGGLAFGPDGKLYLTTGDEFDVVQSQDLSRAGGKVIRVNTDGTIPADNPFVDDVLYPGALDEIWALGLRNPYRAHWDLVDNRFYIGEVGGNLPTVAREDIHLGRIGANFGWPNCEGQCADPSYDDPIFDYDHSVGKAVTVGFVYRGTEFPAEYQNALFIADYGSNWIKYLKLDASGAVTSINDFYSSTPGANFPVHLIQGQDGALYFVDFKGSIKRIVYNDSNQSPEIQSTSVSPDTGLQPLTVNFAATATDLESDPLSYVWDFGDSNTDNTGANVSHTYAQNGKYLPSVAVSDGVNPPVVEQVAPVQVGIPPVVTIDAPLDGGSFNAGDTINFSATATDGDGSIGSNDYEWKIDFIHDEHTHPTVSSYLGDSGQLPVATTGHDYHGMTGFRLDVIVTDSDGLTASDTVNIYPNKVDLSFDTSPSGIPINVDGLPIATPFTYDTLVQFEHEVSVPSSYCLNSVYYDFASWTDGGAATHSITVPATNATYTANYVIAGPCPMPESGLVMHLETDSGVTTSGSVVTSWADLSSSGNDLTSVGDPQLVPNVLNGRSVVDFDGAADLLQRASNVTALPAGNADRTVYLLANYRGTGFGGFAYGNAGCNNTFGAIVNGSGKLTAQGWCSDFHSGVTGTGEGWLIQSLVLESGQLSHYHDGVLIDSRTHNYNTVPAKIMLGAEIDGTPQVDMQVAAVLVYNRALSASEQSDLFTYLESKYLMGGTDQAPVANDDSYTVPVGSTTALSVLANDTDDGALDVTSVVLVQSPSEGVAQVDTTTGEIDYTPNGGAGASDTFSYQVYDDLGLLSNAATVTLTITGGGGNQAPVANADVYTVPVTGTTALSVLANDTDDGTLDVTSVVIVQTPSEGVAQVDALTGEIDYTPNGGTATSDTFTYQVDDDLGLTSNTATVTINLSSGQLPSGGLVMHLETDSGVNTNGSVVNWWSDQSGFGNNLTAAGDPQLLPNVLNGRPVVDFDGTADLLQRTSGVTALPAGNADRTVYLLANYRSVGYGGFAYGKTQCNKTFGTVVNGSGKLIVQGWCNDFHSGVPGMGEGWLIQSVVLESGQLSHYKDGTLIDSRTHNYNTDATKIMLGAEIDGTPQVDMQVAAVLVYDRALSVTEQNDVMTYLQDKYFTGGSGQAPVANDDSYTVPMTGTAALSVLSNDTDDGTLDVASVVLVQSPSEGVAQVDTTTGEIDYTPNAGAGASDTLTYQVYDDQGLPSNAATVTITITGGGGNQAPVANADVYTVPVTGTTALSVLANDTDDGTLDVTSVVIVQTPSEGVAQVDALTGEIDYTPNGGTATSDTFTYQVDDDLGLTSNTATVTINLSSGQLPSGGLVMHLETDSGVTTNATGVAGWSDQSGSGNNLTAAGDPQLLPNVLNGRPVVDFDGTADLLQRTSGVTALPAGNADRTVYLLANYRSVGYGGFAYGKTQCNKTFGTVVNGSGKLIVQGWCNDFHSGVPGMGEGWLIQSVVLESGQLSHYKDGTLIDSRTHNYNTDATKIMLGAEIDGTPQVDMQVAAVLVYDRALSVTEQNDVMTYLQDKYFTGGSGQAPVANDDSYTVPMTGTAALSVLSNDTDDGTLDVTSVVLVQSPSEGVAQVDALTGEIDYTPNAGAGASDTLTYQVYDDQGLPSNAATVTITITGGGGNQAPVANADVYTVPVTGTTALSVLANDTDDGTLDVTSVVIVQTPSEGVAQVDALTGEIDYTPNGGTATSDTFTYQVDDDLGLTSNTATVTINLSSGQLPSGGLVMHLETDSGVTTNATGVTGWSDQSGSGNNLTAAGDPQLLPNVLNGRPVVDFDGTADLLQRTSGVTALPAGNADRTVYLLANYRSVGFGGFAYGKTQCNKTFGTVVNGSGKLIVQGWCNDFHSGVPGMGEGWLIQSVVLESGQLSHYKDGTLIDSRTHNYNTDAAKIMLGAEIDGTPQVDMQVAAVLVYDRALSVTEQNDVMTYLQDKYFTGGTSQAPVANDDSYTVPVGSTTALAVLGNDTDDGILDVTSVVLVQSPSEGVAQADTTTGEIDYTPNGGAGASDTLTYQVYDDQGLPSNAATVTLTITGGGGGNQAPVANDDSYTVPVTGTTTLSVLANDTDDGMLDVTSVQLMQSPNEGVAQVDTLTGQIDYTPNGGTATSDTFTYQVDDDQALTSNTATVAINLSAGQLPSSGLVMHLETDSGVTTNATGVTSWVDLSSSGNDLTTLGDPQLVPNVLNGQAVVDFDGSADLLQRISGVTALPAGNADRTVYVLANYRGTGYGGFAFGTAGCNKTFGAVVNISGKLIAQGWCNDFHTSVAGTGDGWLIQSLVLESGQLSHYKDGVLIDSRAHGYNTVASKIVLGAEIDGTPQIDMQVAAVLVYDRALSASEQNDVLSYLQGKYAP